MRIFNLAGTEIFKLQEFEGKYHVKTLAMGTILKTHR
jgi:hypothetical protein